MGKLNASKESISGPGPCPQSPGQTLFPAGTAGVRNPCRIETRMPQCFWRDYTYKHHFARRPEDRAVTRTEGLRCPHEATTKRHGFDFCERHACQLDGQANSRPQPLQK